MPIKISQSFIKELIEYKDLKVCGKQLEDKFINNNFHKYISTMAMGLGTWFEYLCTGVLPKDGKVPEPTLTKKGEYTSEYKNLLPHVENFKKMMVCYGLEIVEVNYKISYGDCEGTIDVLARAKIDVYAEDEDGKMRRVVKRGQHIIIDLKTSGLLDNKWSDYGWDLSMLAVKYKLTLQPVHYMYLSKKKFNTEHYPFMFFLFNTKSSSDYRSIFFNIDDDTLTQHEQTLVNVRQWIAFYQKQGFQAIPTPERCSDCPIRMDCDDYVTIPRIKIFNFSSANA